MEQQIVRLVEACARRNELERLRALEQRRATILRLATLVLPGSALTMQAHLRALLRRLATGEREFPHPPDDLVEDLHILASYGWVSDVLTRRSTMAAGHPWYLASAVITDEGRNAITEED